MTEVLAAQEVTNDLRVYLGNPADFNWDRALLVVDLAIERAAAVISPVPAAARAIVLDVAVRGYTNPQGADSETVGPFTRVFRSSGVYLTEAQREELVTLVPATRGAFTITPGPRPGVCQW